MNAHIYLKSIKLKREKYNPKKIVAGKKNIYINIDRYIYIILIKNRIMVVFISKMTERNI